MAELKKEIKNGRILKNNGSWMHCDTCNKTAGYLCYTTYENFQFEFDCKCGNKGCFNLRYENNFITKKSTSDLKIIKNRLCCPKDDSPVFTIVDKNTDNVNNWITCKKHQTKYSNG